MPKLLMPYDVYERHQVVSKLLRKRGVRTVLDVGGNLGVLKKFLDAEILTLNVDGSADLQYDGHTIPFEDNRFDAVVSLDTLEHLPPENRLHFLQECVRVTLRSLIIAAPFGSEGHRAYELKIDSLYTQTHGTVHSYLNEHVRYGIPNQHDIEQLVSRLAVTNILVYFAGDFIWQCRNFERLIRRGKSPGLKWYVNVTSRALFHPIRLTTRPYDRANRFYLYAEKPV
ncbi:MAG: methyltransferase domain-containing protein [Deltaproteobacteria bacterium]|nr:methyltransferase domain-containing protein [Deltaproteobacteria bacterium]